jgi:hypothetical protein
MGDKLIESLTTVAVAIVGVAVLAVLVSGQAKTSAVISAGATGFAQDLSVAVSPVTGGQTFNPNGGASLPTNL